MPDHSIVCNINMTLLFVDCGDPAPGNGSSNTPDGTVYGAVALVKCDTGFDLGGDTLVSCLDGGTWSSNATCSIKGIVLISSRMTCIVK